MDSHLLGLAICQAAMLTAILAGMVVAAVKMNQSTRDAIFGTWLFLYVVLIMSSGGLTFANLHLWGYA